MREELLSLLADPVTGDPLRLEVEERVGNEVIQGLLRSPGGACFPVVQGVPIFVPENYSSSFGLQWNRYAKTQLDSVNGANYSRDRLEAEVIPRSGPLVGQTVVDAGCGAGRFAEVAASLGAEVIAVDMSSAAFAAQRNLAGRSNCHVIQADIRHLPLKMETISGLYSIGVLQHTPNPEETAALLVSQLPEGAWFAFTAYGKRPWTRLQAKYLLRPLTRRMKPETLLSFIEQVIPRNYAALERALMIPAIGRVLGFMLPVAVYPSKVAFSVQQRQEEAILDTFDMLSPRFDSPLSARDLQIAIEGLSSELTLTSSRPVQLSGIRG